MESERNEQPSFSCFMWSDAQVGEKGCKKADRK